MITKLYISGKMTGEINYNFYKFFEAERKLKSMMHCEIVNPAYEALKLCEKLGKNLDEIDYKTYLDNSMDKLKECDAIYLLKNWSKSNGVVNNELPYANDNDYEILYEDIG